MHIQYLYFNNSYLIDELGRYLVIYTEGNDGSIPDNGVIAYINGSPTQKFGISLKGDFEEISSLEFSSDESLLSERFNDYEYYRKS